VRWLITETCEYLVEADTREEAEAAFLELGPGPGDGDEVLEFVSVVERIVETAEES
jgi:hypothetical protein